MPRQYSYRFWSPREINLLREMYPSSSKESIMRCITGRSWETIRTKAGALKIKRTRTIKARIDHPLIKKLFERRMELRWSLDKLSTKTHLNATQVSYWETGHQEVTVKNLLAWADALGCEFVLMEKGRTVNPETVQIRLVA